MKAFLLRNQRVVILISSLWALVYSAYSIYGRAKIAFAANEDLAAELITIVADLPMLIPALLGLLYFVKRYHTQAKIPIAFAVLLLAMLAELVLKLTQKDALSYGVLMLVTVWPACILVCILLVIYFFESIRRQKAQRSK
jgi:hypothetical protein